ncbi:MAG: prephenate dehydrogenase/arogenate dehydrogenase family protein [Nitrospirae bacterium]|nr:prephenate dehydrogenase/arogenate dehydrogenase family protein [Nitrospirota bacterium]MBI4838016.1 prephenate dehydrogenase/arogenate dehydrogenase family protein [Nitrospirota bacterium]
MNDLNFKRVAIIGVGLIGGSFALALKKYGFAGKIAGTGRKKENLARAKEMGLIDEYSTSASESVSDADLIVLSTPVGQFEDIFKTIRKNIKAGAIVTDVGSVKTEAIKILEPLMPPGVNFVGSHPIAGKERSGIDSASPDLFKNARCIVTPTPDTDKNSLKKILALWTELGSKTSLMSPEQHDWIFAATSHLPHIIAYALINTILDLNQNTLPHSGPSLRDMTRIALSSPELWRDICLCNKENILKSLNQFLSSITHLKGLIEKSDADGLEKEFQKAQTGRRLLEKAEP